MANGLTVSKRVVDCYQVQALTLILSLVPEKGCIVKNGDISGYTSCIFLKNIPHSSQLYCLNQLAEDGDMRIMEPSSESKCGLEYLQGDTESCHHIISLKGDNPRDFLEWKQPVDLFFEGTACRLPQLRDSLGFWIYHLKQEGIACGCNFRPRFSDVMLEVKRLSDVLNRELIVVENFWCLLPREATSQKMVSVKDALYTLAAEENSICISEPYKHSFSIFNEQHVIYDNNLYSLTFLLCNESCSIWSDDTGSQLDCYICMEFSLLPCDETPISSIHAVLKVDKKLLPDVPETIMASLSTFGFVAGNYSGKAQILLVKQNGSLFKFIGEIRWSFTILQALSLNTVCSHYSVHGSRTPDDWDSVSPIDVYAAYRMILGRVPERGKELIQNHLAQATTLTKLRERFITSQEFLKNSWPSIKNKIFSRTKSDSYCQIDLEVSEQDQMALFRHIQAVWSRLGEVEPHYSVVSHPQFKPTFMESLETKENFYKSGKAEISHAFKYLEELGIAVDGSGIALEYGCGVGRITQNLAEKFSKVYAFDISKPHLQLAQEYTSENSISNVVFEHVNKLDSLIIPEHDFFYSKLVFQHNPPPLTRYLLESIFSKLNCGGVGIFQILTDAKNYSFNIKQYLDITDSIDNQELHAFPLKEIFKIFDRHNISVIDVCTSNSINSFSLEDKVVVCRKR